ncbi:flagellar motor switch protein FliN [Glaciihabitans sp. dw_435]|uniref:flagellar motor switch protein FliN n=1 Tax=Glaciihabitans sp. dw_435 TaxID=2720081 RepID=UPI001BD2C68D|nr:flagellar motor switch protein FliN [Glaciihabitans sp. dw_435]
MTATTTIHDEAAAALVALLPTTGQLRPVLRSPSADLPAITGEAVLATFVGSPSADVAIHLVDAPSVTPDGSGLVSLVDLFTPALQAATGVLGTGVLGEAQLGTASDIVTSPDTVVFELWDTTDFAGWFALRIRTNGTATGGAASDDSVAAKLNRINDVEMALTVEIGRTRMSVRDVLALEPGAVIELDRSAGAPADIMLNGRLIAHGEVVVVDQDYAVRVTRILDVQDGLS